MLLVSDEIYDEFCYEKVAPRRGGQAERTAYLRRCAKSPNALLLRGYSKTYAHDRLASRLRRSDRKPIVEQMTKLQQYSFVCAPSMVQLAGVLAMDTDVSAHVAEYERKRDRVVERLTPHYELTTPGGAFYAFPKVPERLGLTASQFVERAVEKNLLIIPGEVFSERDTHFRLSYATADDTLERGLDVLVELARQQ